MDKKFEIILKDFKLRKKEIYDLMINDLFIYIKNGTPPQSNAQSLMKCYNIIYKFTDKYISYEIINYHNEIIKQAVNECFEKIQNLNGFEFI